MPASVGIADFKGKFQIGETVSVAVDDKWQLITLVNHTSGQDSSLSYFSMGFSEWFSILYFASVSALLFYFVGQKASDTQKYHDYAMFIWAAGLLVVILLFRGVNKQFTESKTASRELKQ